MTDAPVKGPDVRLGDVYLRLAEGSYEVYGIPPMRRPWRSLFAEKQAVSGDPGVENVHTDDLRWQIDSFAGGEGQAFVRIGDQESERRFLSSTWLDHSNPGFVRLGRQMLQKGLTGTGATTIQGNAAGWSGGSVVNSDDRQIDTPGTGTSKSTAALAAGTYQFDIYAYMQPSQTTQHAASSFTAIQGASWGGSYWDINGGYVNKAVSPADGWNQVDFLVEFIGGRVGWVVNGEVRVVRNSDGVVVASKGFFQRISVYEWHSIGYNAEPGQNYSYQVLSFGSTEGGVLRFRWVNEINTGPHGLVWGIRNLTDNQIKASGGLHLNGVTTKGVKVASATVAHTGSVTYQLEFTWSSGEAHKIVIDKFTHEGVGIDDPRTIELGMGDSIWMTDFNATAPPSLLYWDEATQKWIAIGNVGGNGEAINHMAHTTNYEYVHNQNTGLVWRVTKTPGSQVQYTQSLTWGRAIAVAANRLYGLAFYGDGSGVRLFEVALDQTAGLPLAWSAVIYQGTTADLSGEPHRPQQMASLPNGVVFFLNLGSECVVHAYNASTQTGVPVAEMPPGFRGEAIVHGNGYTFIGGEFPARDSAGTLRMRPALFMIDHLVGQTAIQQVDVKLYRDHELGATVRGMQLYGSDLYIMTDVDADPPDHPTKHFHIWRVSLKDPSGVFCEQEVITDETQAAEQGRGLAVNHKTKFAIWGKGMPYLEDTKFRQEGDLITSRSHLGVTEEKLLLYIDVMGEFPGNTQTATVTTVEIRCGADDMHEDDWESCGIWTQAEARLISLPVLSTRFKYLRLKAILRTTDVAQTPTLYAIGVRGTLTEFDRVWELFLRAHDETATDRLSGRQLPGSMVTDFIYALAGSGQVVEFEDLYTHKKPEHSRTYYVTVETPEYIAQGKGEGVIRVRLTERGTG